MRKWLRKTIVVLVSALTFGLITPPLVDSYQDATENKTNKGNEVQPKGEVYAAQVVNEAPPSPLSEKEQFLKTVVKDAELHSYEKFGTRIKPVIEEEFREVILPNIENAIKEVIARYDEEHLRYLTISERPTGGQSERIFHIYDAKHNQDVIRFHVRRDHPPKEGYWFNFHYHTYHDNFQKHHSLGSIYWAKNTPPKWMS